MSEMGSERQINGGKQASNGYEIVQFSVNIGLSLKSKILGNCEPIATSISGYCGSPLMYATK